MADPIQTQTTINAHAVCEFFRKKEPYWTLKLPIHLMKDMTLSDSRSEAKATICIEVVNHVLAAAEVQLEQYVNTQNRVNAKSAPVQLDEISRPTVTVSNVNYRFSVGDDWFEAGHIREVK